MNPYTVKDRDTAIRLQRYFASNFSIACELKPFAGYWQLSPMNGEHPCWREICDAFVAGVQTYKEDME